ncbi:MAG: CDP-alcohol phosphatidyltransferase family protein [Thermodesulfobacteriaceae bacterium]|nr:CDP-alcohol phosphatidyltransferase family protein [Thermodesulfobacteriaceae bacterium]
MSKLGFSEKIKISAEPLLLPIVRLLANLNVHPNIITSLCLVGFIISAFFVAQGKFLLAGLILLAFAPLDAIDGLLARTANKITKFGAFLDSTMDRYGEIFLFLAFTYYFLLKGSVSGVIISFLGITGSIMVSYTRARAEGLGITCKVGLFTRFERIALIILSLILETIFLALTILAFLTHITALQRIWYVYRATKS